MAEPTRASLARYLAEAFKFRWNLLLFGGGLMLGPARNRRIKGPIFEGKGRQLRGIGRPVRRGWGRFHCGDDG
jgi:hypothetical protein